MDTIKTKLAGFAIYSFVLLILAFFVGYQARVIWPPTSENLHLLLEANRMLKAHFLGDIPDTLSLQRGMIRGMIDEFHDPYTIYLEPTLHELQSDRLTGEYGGIGAYLSVDEEGLFHVIPFQDGPAARAGVLEGDILVAVDGITIEPNANQDEVLAMVRGVVGTSLILKLAAREPAEGFVTLEIMREAFSIPSVTGYILPMDSRIGVVVISLFSERTPQEVEQAYHDLQARGAEAIILNLRNNTGGLLDSGISVARFFLKDGLVLVENRRGGEITFHRVKTEGKASDVPLVVLVNGNTASAAEVVAAALQANHRAELIGVPTYGKGSVQIVLALSDGSSLHITNAQWETPDRVRLDNHGLVPDILLDSEDETENGPVMRAAVNWIYNSMRGFDEETD